MAVATYRLQAWKHARSSVWFVVGVVLVVGVISRLSWHDYAELQDGRQGRILAASGTQHTVIVQIDGTPMMVAMGDIAVLKPGVGRLMHRANVPLLLGASLLALPVPFLNAIRVQLLLKGLQVSIRGARILAVCLLGYVVNATALGSTGGEIYRAMTLRRDVEAWDSILACLLADRLAGLAVLVTYTALSALWYMQHAIFGTLALWIIGVWLGGVALGLLGLGIGRHQWRAHWSNRLLHSRLRMGWVLVSSIGSALRNSVVLTKVLLVSVAIQAANLGAMALMGYAFGFDYALETALLVMPLATILAVLIPTPQGFGVIEGVLIAILASHVSGGANMCVLFALGVRLLRIVWALPGIVLLGARYLFSSTTSDVTP
jgi:uncharacterized membrane protein YbhN (UPF0104 family)